MQYVTEDKGPFAASAGIEEILRKKRGRLFIKRAFDIVISGLALAVLWPVLLLIAAIVAIDSPGGALYRQQRVGRYGRLFRILKYRTMRTNDGAGMQITVGGDPRITRCGKWLRSSKLDEIPQLFNVFVGDMSFVGPRPEVPKYVALYTDEQRQALLVRPGVTDPASIEYRRESQILSASDDPEKTYVEQIMRDKLRLNLQYIPRISLWTDIKIIFRTLRLLFA